MTSLWGHYLLWFFKYQEIIYYSFLKRILYVFFFKYVRISILSILKIYSFIFNIISQISHINNYIRFVNTLVYDKWSTEFNNIKFDLI